MSVHLNSQIQIKGVGEFLNIHRLKLV
jgi:hypothetical protein